MNLNKIKRTMLRARHLCRVKSFELRNSESEFICDILKTITPAAIGEPLVRAGASNDGGYLVPRSAMSQDVVVSPGVSRNSTFELAFAERGATCYLFDASVSAPAVIDHRFKFYQKFWGLEDDADFIDAPSWIKANIDPKARNALQIDIEGAEYEIVDALPDEILRFFNLIVIEVHGFQSTLDEALRDRNMQFFRKLTEHHRVVHFHPNNNIRPVQFNGIDIPDCFELTLVRDDYPLFSGSSKGFSQHPLDTPCVPTEREVTVNWDRYSPRPDMANTKTR